MLPFRISMSPTRELAMTGVITTSCFVTSQGLQARGVGVQPSVLEHTAILIQMT